MNSFENCARIWAGVFEPEDSTSLGDRAIERGLVTPSQMEECLAELRSMPDLSKKCRVAQVLLSKCLVTAEQFLDLIDAEDSRPADPHVGLQIGKYRLLRRIAQGGMGTVYEARDGELGRSVAVKLIPGAQAGPEVVARLHREGAIMARLRHPNIVSVFEVGVTPDGLHYIALEYVPGSTFANVLADSRVTLPEKLRMVEEIARAVEYAHSQGILHRDLKPANILVEGGGRVLLTDFGLAKADTMRDRLTRTMDVFGTPVYMAPEQVAGRTREIDARTDVYALGVILYEGVTGRLPFLGNTPNRLFHEILTLDPPTPHRCRPGISRDLEVICLKAIAKESGRRYSTAGALADDLARLRRGEPILARPPSFTERIGRWIRRRKPVAAAALIGLAAMSLMAGGLLHRWVQEKRERESQQRLAMHWTAILEAKRNMRQGVLAPEKARQELQESVRAMDSYVGARSKDPRGYYVRARGKLYLGDLEGAERDTRLALEVAPNFRPGWCLLGTVKVHEYQALIWQGGEESFEEWRRSEGVKLLEEAAAAFERAPDPAQGREEWNKWGLPWTLEEEILQNVGKALAMGYGRTGDREGAKRLLLRHYENGTRSEEYAFWLGALSRDDQESLRWGTQALAVAQGYAEAHLAHGVLLNKIKDWNGAIREYSRAIELRSGWPPAYAYRGMSRVHLQDWSGAIEDLSEGIKLGFRQAGAFCQRGTARQAYGDLDGAMEDFARALELDPAHDHAYFARGGIRFARRDFLGAISEYSQAIERSPNLAQAFYNRAWSKSALRDHEGAIADYSRAIELRKDYAEAWFHRAGEKRSRRDERGAIEDYTEAIRIRSDHPESYCNRAGARGVLREFDGAIEDCTRAIELRKDYAGAYYNRGLAYEGKKDRPAALRDFTQAIEHQKNFGSAYYRRGLAHRDSRQVSEAIADLKQALVYLKPGGPEHSSADRALRKLISTGSARER